MGFIASFRPSQRSRARRYPACMKIGGIEALWHKTDHTTPVAVIAFIAFGTDISVINGTRGEVCEVLIARREGFRGCQIRIKALLVGIDELPCRFGAGRSPSQTGSIGGKIGHSESRWRIAAHLKVTGIAPVAIMLAVVVIAAHVGMIGHSRLQFGDSVRLG